MKYKKHIATGALAFSLLVGGSAVLAATPQDLGIKDTQSTFQKQLKTDKVDKVNKNEKGIKSEKRNNVVGTISAVDSTGFTMDVKNLKAKTSSSVEVKTDVTTLYTKNGITAQPSEFIVGQKVVVVGALDKTTNVMTAKKVKIVANVVAIHTEKKYNKKVGAKIAAAKITVKTAQ